MQTTLVEGLLGGGLVTRARLQIETLAVALLVLLFGYTSWSAATNQHNGVKQVMVDAGASVLDAHAIRADLQLFAADQIDAQLVSQDQAAHYFSDAQTQLDTLDAALTAAIENITYPGEAEALASLRHNLDQYLDQTREARDAYAGGRPLLALSPLLSAQGWLSKADAAATQLAAVNSRAQTSLYADRQSGKNRDMALVVLTGLLLAAGLLRLSWVLRRLMKRLVNLGLAGALLVGVVLVALLLGALNNSSHQLYVAKSMSFDSVNALTAAEADSNTCNTIESVRELPGIVGTPSYDAETRAYLSCADRVARIPAGYTYASIADLIEQNAALPSAFTGDLADEARNITFDGPQWAPANGERHAAAEAVRTFGVYVNYDAHLRQEDAAGHHVQAVADDLGLAPGQSNYLYAQYLNTPDHPGALDTVLAINRYWMDAGHRAADHAIASLPLLSLLATAVMLAAVIGGMMPRMGEPPV